VTLEERIRDGCDALGLQLPEAALWKYARYLRLIEKWNRVHNLTAVRECEQMVSLHLLDSLSILPHIDREGSLLDVGSGAGLPGIPLAVAEPRLQATLLDSSHKKTVFLEQARNDLELANVGVVCERVEQWRPGHTFDVVVSRAFADLAEFAAQAGHLLSPKGRLLAMKGVYPFEELARLPATGATSRVVELQVPGLEAKRHLVIIEKPS
jgi:16S rRNA (guanine527-N7)-methyltransferase